MKFNSVSFNKNALSIILLVIRVFIGLAMLTHGYPKLQRLLSEDQVQFFRLFGLSAKITLILAVFAEVICSIFLILGLFTRTFCLPLIFTMIVAGFVIHGADAFEVRELAILYLVNYLFIFVAGGGKYSIDYLMNSSKKTLY